MKLINRVVPLRRLDEEVDQWCEEILSLSPGCIEILKAAFDSELDQLPALGVHGAMLHPDWFDTPEGQEGTLAFMEKRKKLLKSNLGLFSAMLLPRVVFLWSNLVLDGVPAASVKSWSKPVALRLMMLSLST